MLVSILKVDILSNCSTLDISLCVVLLIVVLLANPSHSVDTISIASVNSPFDTELRNESTVK